MNWISFLGYLAGALAVGSLIPQVVKSWKTKSIRYISLMRYLIYTLGLVLWVTYSLLIHNGPVAVTNGIGLVLAVAILFFEIEIWLTRKSQRNFVHWIAA